MRLPFIAFTAALMLAAGSTRTTGQDGRSVVTAAARAMGADALKTVTLTGSGSQAGVGQNITPTDPWPLVPLKTYTRAIDVEAPAATFDAVRVQNRAETPVNQVVPGDAPWDRRFEVWVTTPYVFLKGAMANPTTLRSEVVNEVRYNVVSFTVDGKFTVAGYISDKNLVERVRTWVDNDVMGNMLVEGVFGDYRDFGGLKVPTLTIVKQGGFPTLIAGVTEARANMPATRPAAVAPAPAAPTVTITAEKIAAGVTALKGGSHHSLLVEFADHVTLIEGPQNEARALALIQEIKKLYPNKPLTQVVNTHHHFDHAGGLRTFVDAGATIFTHEINRPFYLETFKAPRTLNPDRLERSKRTAIITAVADKLVLSDATRTLELYPLGTNPHDRGMLIAFLPKEKLLVEADMYTPPAPTAPPPAADAPVNPNAVALVENLERLRLDFETILPLHGAATATRANLYAFIRKPLVPVSSLPDVDKGTARSRGGRGGEALPPPTTPAATPATPGAAAAQP